MTRVEGNIEQINQRLNHFGEELEGIRQTMDRRFEGIDRRFEALDRRFQRFGYAVIGMWVTAILTIIFS
jgi:hypothetical protein